MRIKPAARTQWQPKPLSLLELFRVGVGLAAGGDNLDARARA